MKRYFFRNSGIDSQFCIIYMVNILYIFLALTDGPVNNKKIKTFRINLKKSLKATKKAEI